MTILAGGPLVAAHADQLFSAEGGFGQGDTRIARFSYAYDTALSRTPGERWNWGVLWEGNLSYWYKSALNSEHARVMEVGLTPNLRLERADILVWARPYFEIGVGLHLLSNTEISDRDLGSIFHFGSHTGIGIRFGDAEQYEVAWRIEHLSNAGIWKPNPGINFTMVRLGYRW